MTCSDENGDCWHTEQELSVWESDLCREFPRTIESEASRVWIDRAIEFQCHDEGLAFLDKWEKEHPEEPLSSLKHLRLALGDIKGAIAHQRRLLKSVSSSWDKVSAATSLAELLVNDGKSVEAWQIIEEHSRELQQVDGWREVGLGRRLVRTTFVIANAPVHSASRAAYQWACEHGDELAHTTLEILQIANQAAIRLADHERAQTFQRAASDEQARIDSLLRK